MSKQARERRVALGAEYQPHGHKLSRKTAARGAHNKKRLEHLNERFRAANLPLQSTLCAAETQRKKLSTLLAAQKALAAESAAAKPEKGEKKDADTAKHKADAWAGKIHRLLNKKPFDEVQANVLIDEMQQRIDAGHVLSALEERAWVRINDAF